MSSITRFLPKNHLSYIVGQLVHIPLPTFLSKFIIANFAKFYSIDLNEAELPIESYNCLGEFFVRRLKPGIRPVGSTNFLHPADSLITQADDIRDGKLIQAKGKTYTLKNFVKYEGAESAYRDGQFITYYLCPTDYHRVHSPVTGSIKRVVHIPGALWPVNMWSTDNINELFSVNERVFVEIETAQGLAGVMFVGATNVGQIELSFDRTIKGNQLLSDQVYEKLYENMTIEKGEELGMFRMGSTIVMLYSNKVVDYNSLQALHGKNVKVNSPLV